VHLRDRINLIPRNNWDYGVAALFGTLARLRNHPGQAPNIENIFHLRPLWTNTGRTSLYAILKALELPKGAKVGVPLFCCSVVFNAIQQADLSPCFIDINLSDGNISAADLLKKRADLAAVIAVHMFGKPCDVDAILTAAGTIPVIEDCAQSLFSKYKGRQTGLLSTASFFSFRCGKYLSAGEGSAIFCQDAALHKRIEQIVSAFESYTTVHGMASWVIRLVCVWIRN
jgi:perosamine synthetase